MPTRSEPWPAGTPCWADLASPDVAAAQAFYGPLLGWTFEESGAEYGGYVMARTDGHDAAGIGPLQDPTQPPAWTLYFASEDADATATAVQQAGGTVLVEAFDVPAKGRMAIAADPSGAAFGIWQAGGSIGAEIVNTPGSLVWEDLRSTQPDAAAAFYQAVFAHRVTPMPEAGPDYGTFALGDGGLADAMGGIGGMMGAPEGTPSHWLVYFGVADTDAAVAETTPLGGTVLAPAFDTPYGRMAAMRDPAGAVFWVVQTAPEGSAPA
jgi:hypothetical protein